MTADSNSRPTRVVAPTSRAVRYFSTIVRLLFGAGFIVFGLNGFLNFIPPPAKPMPEAAMAFAMALMNTGYMMRLVAGTQLVVGLLLVANRFVPLALVLLAPVIVNIVAFHVFLERSGLPIALVVAAMELYLVWVYRCAFRPLLRAVPRECETAASP